jgi:hypothetical protein
LQKNLYKPVWHRASIFAGKGQPVVPCTIADISRTGAEITVDPQVEIPSEFTLLLTEDGRVRRHCRLASREETQIQVYFVSRVPTYSSRVTVLES